MKTGDLTRVRADRISLEGESVSRLANVEVRAPGIFPGEEATVKITAVSRHHARAFATLDTLHQLHPARRRAPCLNHVTRIGACHGCALMELSEEAQRDAKRQMLVEQFGLPVEQIEAAPQQLGYRLSSKRVALLVKGQLRLGSFARGSHTPAPMTGCLVDHPRLVQAFDELEQVAQTQSIVPFDEQTKQGDLRYVWAKTNGSEVIVTLVVTAENSRARALLPPRLKVDGVLVSVQAAAGNALRGGDAQLLRGRGEVSIKLLGQQVEVGALGFLQPNPQVAEQAYRMLLGERMSGQSEELAFDLYAGAGLTTAALKQRFNRVIACEAFPESAASLGIEACSVEELLERELSAHERRTPDLVIANPPRKGLGARVTRALNQLGARELRIMSCGPEGLARDLTDLTNEAGAYQLVTLRAFDTLPQTPHVELVAVLKLAKSALPQA